MKTSVAAILTSSLLLWHPVLADDLLACMDPDVVRTLLATPAEGSIEITREWAAGFPDVKLPDEFELIGSRVSSFASMIAFKSSLSIVETKVRIEELVTGSGWERFGKPTPGYGGGFLIRERVTAPQSMMFCNDVQGNLTIALARSASGASYVTLWAPLRASPDPCQSQRNAEIFAAGRTYQMPELFLPEDGFGYPEGGGSSNHEETSTAYLESSRTAAELLEHFGRQLAEQEWRQRTQWVNAKVSGSTWLAKDGSESGLLTVIDLGNQEYNIGFRAVRLQ